MHSDENPKHARSQKLSWGLTLLQSEMIAIVILFILLAWIRPDNIPEGIGHSLGGVIVFWMTRTLKRYKNMDIEKRFAYTCLFLILVESSLINSELKEDKENNKITNELKEMLSDYKKQLIDTRNGENIEKGIPIECPASKIYCEKKKRSKSEIKLDLMRLVKHAEKVEKCNYSLFIQKINVLDLDNLLSVNNIVDIESIEKSLKALDKYEFLINEYFRIEIREDAIFFENVNNIINEYNFPEHIEKSKRRSEQTKKNFCDKIYITREILNLVKTQIIKNKVKRIKNNIEFVDNAAAAKLKTLVGELNVVYKTISDQENNRISQSIKSLDKLLENKQE